MINPQLRLDSALKILGVFNVYRKLGEREWITPEKIDDSVKEILESDDGNLPFLIAEYISPRVINRGYAREGGLLLAEIAKREIERRKGTELPAQPITVSGETTVIEPPPEEKSDGGDEVENFFTKNISPDVLRKNIIQDIKVLSSFQEKESQPGRIGKAARNLIAIWELRDNQSITITDFHNAFVDTLGYSSEYLAEMDRSLPDTPVGRLLKKAIENFWRVERSSERQLPPNLVESLVRSAQRAHADV